MNTTDPSSRSQTPCRNLRYKEMYYQGPGPSEVEPGSGACWCQKTQEPFGPDGQPASKDDCTEGRSCYEGT